MADNEEQELEVAVNPEGRVHVLDRQGLPATVAEADVGKALAAGYQLESRQAVDARSERAQFETPLEQAKAAGEGAVRGATLGLGTAALAELGGDEYRDAAARRMRLFPGTAVAGEVAGALAPGLLTGGTGAAASVARATPVSLAARAGSAAEHLAGAALGGFGREGAGLAARAAREAIRLGAAGSVEGAAYGLGSSLADAALEGVDWTAERALTGAKEGAIYGATGGAALGAGGEVAKAAGRRVLDAMIGEGKTLRQAVQDFADGRTIKTSVGNDVRTMRKLTNNGENPERIGEAAEWMRERQIPTGGPIEETRDALKVASKVEGSNMDQVAKELDGAGVRVDPRPIIEKLERRLGDLDTSGLSGPKALARTIRRQVEPLRQLAEKGEGAMFSQLWRDSSFIGAKVREAARKASPASVQLEALYDDLRGALRSTAETASPELVTKWRSGERSYAIAKTLYDGATTEAQRQLKNRFISPSDYGTGLAGALATMVTGGGAPAAVLTGLATSAAHKLIRERGSAVIGRIADWAAKTELGANRAVDRLAGVAEKEGELAGPLLRRLRETGKVGAKAGVESRDVSHRAEEREHVGKTILRGAQRLEGHEEEGSHEERFEKARDEVLAAQRDPGVLASHIQKTIEPIAHEQPEVASAMAQKIVADHAWLASKLPHPVSHVGKSLAPADAKPLTSRRDQRKFVSYAEALNHTKRALQKLESGKIDFDALDAIKARRPALWSSMQQRAALRLSEPGSAVPHRRRVMLSLVFDLPGDPSMAPGALAAIGRSLAPPENQAAPPPKSQLDPKQFSHSMQTPSQQATG